MSQTTSTKLINKLLEKVLGNILKLNTNQPLFDGD